MKAHPSPRYLFLPELQRDYGSPVKLLPPKLVLARTSIPLTTSAYLPSRTRRRAPMSEASSVSSTKNAFIRVAPFRSALGLWRRDPLDLPLTYNIFDAVPWGEKRRQRKLGFTFDDWVTCLVLISLTRSNRSFVLTHFTSDLYGI